ncbi:MAG: uncharacterized protein KVP18_002176 [Porospora cf. gigantea A]|uniref:uncharacterized protein n=1 Tax=Porospora cf. gigantea A TaxID=2853593 RepID=UPI00355A905C|nr:MAG: hypothetical protein KVP18_002176 [Porospora cf. gigantea A]
MYAWNILISIIAVNLISLVLIVKGVFDLIDPRDLQFLQGHVGQLAAIVGLQFAANGLLVLPVDVYAGFSGQNILPDLYWTASYLCCFLYLMLLAPYALLFAGAESSHGSAKPNWRKSAWFKASFWALATFVICLAAAGLLFLLIGEYVEMNDVGNPVRHHLNFGYYALAMTLWVGMFFVMVFGPVGLVSIPLHCILRYVDRPVPATAQAAEDNQKDLLEVATTLRLLGEGLKVRTGRVLALRGCRGRWKRYRNAVIVEKYLHATSLLRRHHIALQKTVKYKGIYSVQAWLWLTLGIVCAVVALLWTIQVGETIHARITGGMAAIRVFDRLLAVTSSGGAFILLLLVYGPLYSFLLLTPICGFWKSFSRLLIGLRVAPLRKNATHADLIVGFTMVTVVSVGGINVMLLNTCPEWSAAAYITEVMGRYSTNTASSALMGRYLPLFWIYLSLEVAAILYFVWRPRDAYQFPLDTPADLAAIRELAQSWLREDVALDRLARLKEHNTLRELGERIQKKEHDLHHQGKNAVNAGAQAALNPRLS